jgi:hypothetical protein
MPDGSYYIRPGHPQDLTNAVMAVGRASGSDGTSDEEQRLAVRKHIIKRANQLGRSSALPNTWNPDGTLTTDAQHSELDLSDIDDFFEHFGVKGMHWGVRHTPEELSAKASEHENKAKAYSSAAKQMESDHADLLKNGLQSRAIKRVYGDNAHMQNDWSFYAKNGISQAQALQETSNNLRVAHNSYARSANRHTKRAAKLRSQLSTTEHSAFETEEDSLEHFGRKGMKWGEHIFGRGTDSAGRNKAAAKVASDSHASPDAKAASDLQSRVNASGTKNLNNKELQDLVTRMNLEQQYSRLSTGDVKKGQSLVQKYNTHTQASITAIKVTKEAIKILGPLIVAGAAAAAASKASGHSGPVRMQRLAIGS